MSCISSASSFGRSYAGYLATPPSDAANEETDTAAQQASAQNVDAVPSGRAAKADQVRALLKWDNGHGLGELSVDQIVSDVERLADKKAWNLSFESALAVYAALRAFKPRDGEPLPELPSRPEDIYLFRSIDISKDPSLIAWLHDGGNEKRYQVRNVADASAVVLNTNHPASAGAHGAMANSHLAGCLAARTGTMPNEHELHAFTARADKGRLTTGSVNFFVSLDSDYLSPRCAGRFHDCDPNGDPIEPSEEHRAAQSKAVEDGFRTLEVRCTLKDLGRSPIHKDIFCSHSPAAISVVVSPFKKLQCHVLND